MGLPIGINQLLNGKVVEWERIDFKKGWNPEDVVHSICAFANDMHNWGGGYIVIGVEEDKGTPMLPPIGIDIKDLDDIQKEVLNLMHKIEPLPIVIPEPVEYMGKNILILWIPGGEARPYKAPIHLGSKEMQKAYFIRQGSVTKKATLQEEQVLLSLAAKIPFDDRICHTASLDDLSLLYIRDFLRKVDSDITEKDIQSMPFEQLCWQMQIIGGTPEFIRPKNVGLLFFSENPEKYIPYARIELVRFYDDVGDHFDEKILHGPMPPITNDDLQNERVLSRNYRNRRIGDFLKELDMTEGRSTGFPKIYRAMRNNGSPDPVFKTDDLNQYFLAELPIHPAFVGDNVAQDVVENVVENVVDRMDLIVLLLKEDNTLSAAQLAKQLGVTARTIQRDLEKLSKAERIKHIGPDKGGHWEVL